ncbi:MAG: aminopeptidase P family protein [Phycisphaerae bacterium]|nr:aminopeptidase P family protein [Phycisphaerae bacterium]
MFSAEVYHDRRRRLMNQIGSGLILLPGHLDAPMNYLDNPYPFRQDSSFLYFVGLDQPGLAAVLDIDSGVEMVFGSDPTEDSIVWTGPLPLLHQQVEQVGISRTQPIEQLPDCLRQARQQGRAIHYLPPCRPETTIQLHRWLNIPIDEIQSQCSHPLIRAVVEQRSIKSADEIRQIESAIEITHSMVRAAARVARPGVREYQVVAAVDHACRWRGGMPGFISIVTTHGEVLHNRVCNETLKAGDLLVCDIGGESAEHYTGDITRTFPVGGRFDSRQKDIYTIVYNAQRTAMATMRPGVEFREIHRLACVELARGLIAIGLMKGDPNQAVAAGAHTLFFPCGLGHMLGLDVHDMEGLGEDFVGYTGTIRRNPAFGFKSLRLAKPLEPGFVVTVEPGIYLIPDQIDRWQARQQCGDFIDFEALQKWRDFGGIRVEDVTLVKERGCKILGSEFASTADQLEELIQSEQAGTNCPF